MKKLLSIIAFGLACVFAVHAGDEKDFSFDFYGRVRAHLFYNSRENNENVDGLFYLYPKDHDYDPDGNDINSTPQGSLYMLYTRMGVNIKGPNLGTAKATANIELDFRGSGTTFSLIRLRQAYVNLDWSKVSLLVGQTWHPLFGEVSPSILNLSTGAPFQPFNRSPMVRAKLKLTDNLRLTGAAIWQMQFNSAGPEGKSHIYLKNSCIPELFVGLDFCEAGWTVGASGELLSLKPRLTSVVNGNKFKVNERVTSFSSEFHVKYKCEDFMVSGKTVLANNLTQASMLGGYGVTQENSRTGEKKYTPFHHSMTWLNFVCGKKWQPGVFLGYLKNFGTGKKITGETYGVGLDVDQLFSSNWQLSYNMRNLQVGLEFSTSTAWFGDLDISDGKIVNTHAVTNYRVLGALTYIF